MADGPASAPPADAQAWARDWITIWQSELAALATDREMQDNWVRLVSLWAQAAENAARFLPAGPPHPGERANGRPGSAAPAGAEAPMAAPDARDAAIEHLARRVEELERRLAAATGPSREPGT